MATVSITVSEAAYRRLKKLKLKGDSFSDVIMRELPEPCDTCGEILDSFRRFPAPEANADLEKAVLQGRGRRSRRS